MGHPLTVPLRDSTGLRSVEVEAEQDAISIHELRRQLGVGDGVHVLGIQADGRARVLDGVERVPRADLEELREIRTAPHFRSG